MSKKKSLRGALMFLPALWAGKMSMVLLRLLGRHGTNFPGRVALKLCPDFLGRVARPKKIVAITGTNGKTTVTNMAHGVLELSGKKVLTNMLGSNTNTGIAAVLIEGATVFNRCRYELGVFEVDERSAVRIYPYMEPDLMLIINLFRDSIMRNGHPQYMADFLTRFIPRSTRLILNADDLISSGVAPANDRVYFSIEALDSDLDHCINLVNDVRVCPKCLGELKFDRVRCHHIGRAHCESCGFESPKGDYTAVHVDEQGGIMRIRESGGEFTVPAHPNVNPYDTLAVAALMRELGMDRQEISRMMDKVTVPASRHSEEQAGRNRVIMHMAKDKNAVACSRAFDVIKNEPGEKEILLMTNCLSDERHWSENVCWMFDCDFEFLNDPRVTHIIACGPRYLDYRLRLLMAGVPEERISCERDEARATELLQFKPGTDIYMLYGADSVELAFRLRENVIEMAKEAAK